MAPQTPTTTKPALARLDWESQHFGLSAARLDDAYASDSALEEQLDLARTGRVELVVWATEGDREVSPGMLNRFGGMLVDRKATFSRSLREIAPESVASPPAELSVIAYPAATASAALVELGISAGAFSRFRIDPRIPSDRFEAMYRIWVERSVRGELADVVLIVPAEDRRSDAHERPLGMITLSEANGLSNIGLVAVVAAARGRGIGAALMRAAHRWMLGRDAREGRVVTQLANAAACRLYERAGYQLMTVQNYYHFWL